jgi:hypothetical protein
MIKAEHRGTNAISASPVNTCIHIPLLGPPMFPYDGKSKETFICFRRLNMVLLYLRCGNYHELQIRVERHKKSFK